MSNMKSLADIMKVCSVLPLFAVAPAMADVEKERLIVVDGETLTLQQGKEYSGYVLTGNNDGAVVNVAKNGTLNVDGVTFTKNDSHDGGGFGGAIWNTGEAEIKNSVFEENVATSGGAVGGSKNSTGVLTIENSTFKNNHANADGGAVAAFKTLKVINSTFENNTAMYTQDETGAWTKKSPTDDNPMGGGAIALGAESDTSVLSISGTTFQNNKSGYNGGAIATRLADKTNGGKNANSGKLDISATFISNVAAKNGGAIYNTFYNDNDSGNGRGVTVSGLFKENKAGGYGGAIFNDGRKDLAVKDAEGNVISGGKGGVMTVYNAKFEDNQANLEGGYGGAIFNYYGDMDIKGTEKDRIVFEDNIAYVGGAFSDFQVDSNYPGLKSTTLIEHALFEENHAAADAGAAGLYGDVTLNDVIFRENTAAIDTDEVKADLGNSDGGGAVQVGGTANVTMSNVHFVENESGARGGAISARHDKTHTLDIDNATFAHNKSGNFGGGIANIYSGIVDLNNVTFATNLANKEGGAIYNGVDKNYGVSGGVDSTNHGTINIDGENTFTGNWAGEKGGAIYSGGGVINMNGTNVFTNNTIGDEKAIKNDIYNDGELNILGGTTTIGGGVSGSGTLNLAAGATLDIGTSLIEQGVMNIDGTLVASVLNDSRKSFGRLLGKVNVGDTAKLQLNVGAVGTYDIFAGQFIDADRITVGNAYTAHATEKGIVIETKAIEDLAADTGLTTQAAGMIAGLANSDNKSVQSISLMAQEALNAGDVEFVEQEMAKLNPTSTPVAQAVSASVQNQVLSLTAGRMSGVGTTVGRAGGSASQQSGFWLQGLFNKSKYEGQFHGYTRGFAFGGDTVLDRVLTLGGGFAYNNTDVHATDGRHTDIDSKTLFAYAQYKPNKWYANLTATYSMSEYNEDVSVLGVLSNVAYDVDAYGAQFMTGYDFASGVTTEIGARYMHVDQDAYVNAVGGKVQADETNFLSGVAGLKYAFTIKNNSGLKLRPELRAAATYDFINDGTVATVVMPGAASYQVSGDSLSRLGGEFGVGLTAQFNGGDLSIMYDLDLHTDYTSHTGMVKFRGWF